MKAKQSKKTQKVLYFSEDCALWKIEKGLKNLKHTNHQMLSQSCKSLRTGLHLSAHTTLKTWEVLNAFKINLLLFVSSP